MTKFFNILLIAFAVFWLSFVWLYYYVKVAWICALCSGGLALSLSLILSKLLPLKTKKSLNANQKKQLERLELYLSLNRSAEIISKLFAKKEYNVFFVENGFIAKKDSLKIYVRPCYGFKPFEKADFALASELMSRVGADMLIIFGKTNFDVKPLCEYKNIKCKIFATDDLQKLLTQNDLMPPLPDLKIKKDKRFFIYAFNENRFPYYIISSIALVGFSVVTFFPIYTLISATILLAAAIYSKFNTKYNEKTRSLV